MSHNGSGWSDVGASSGFLGAAIRLCEGYTGSKTQVMCFLITLCSRKNICKQLPDLFGAVGVNMISIIMKMSTVVKCRLACDQCGL